MTNYKGNDILDWRSTGRKRGRRALFESRRPFKCAGVSDLDITCNKTTKRPPPDAPKWFNQIWPKENRVLSQLQVDHISKDYKDNDLSNLQWVCASCHRLSDNMTGPGESKTDYDWTGYL